MLVLTRLREACRGPRNDATGGRRIPARHSAWPALQMIYSRLSQQCGAQVWLPWFLPIATVTVTGDRGGQSMDCTELSG